MNPQKQILSAIFAPILDFRHCGTKEKLPVSVWLKANTVLERNALLKSRCGMFALSIEGPGGFQRGSSGDSCWGTRHLRRRKRLPHLPTPATRSAPFIRHRRRSHRSPLWRVLSCLSCPNKKDTRGRYVASLQAISYLRPCTRRLPRRPEGLLAMTNSFGTFSNE